MKQNIKAFLQLSQQYLREAVRVEHVPADAVSEALPTV